MRLRLFIAATFSIVGLDVGLTPISGAGATPAGAISRPMAAGFLAGSISVGNQFVCGIQTGGAGLCWGYNPNGQVNGVPNTTYPNETTSAPPGGGTFIQISAGGTHSCGVRTNGTVLCWGDDSYGEVNGVAHTSAPLNAIGGPPGGGTFTQVTAGDGYTCGIRTDGSALCWGDNFAGEINGTPNTTSPYETTASPPGFVPFTEISAGGSSTCGLRTDGTIVCWGYDGNGQLDGTATTTNTIGSPPGGGTFTEVSAGYSHSCGVKTDGQALCWGDDANGELDGQPNATTLDGSAPGGSTFVRISAGQYFTCGVKANGGTVCWGSDVQGQINGVGTASAIGTAAGSWTALDISAGSFSTCALRTAGYVYCWGENASGEVNGTPTTTSPYIAQGYSPGAGYFLQPAISAGGNHACSIASVSGVGSLTCTGDDTYGQLNGVASTSTHTATAAGSYIQVSTGQYHTCGLTADHNINCWGDVGVTGPMATNPPAGTFTQVASGGAHSCGLRPNGNVVCWGDETLAVAGPFVQITAGALNSCGVTASSQVYCWGDNSYGQSTPPTLEPAAAVSAGGESTCALQDDSTLACWGNNSYVQSRPEAGQQNQVSVGAFHACSVGIDGTAYCWGDDVNGEADDPPGTFLSLSAGGGLTTGDNLSCGVLTNGGVECWGLASSFSPTSAPSFSYLTIHPGKTSTLITWKGVKRAIGYNVLSHGHTLNAGLVRSRTLKYSFTVFGTVHHIRLAPVERIR
ncbi:MAG TPA: hypothetical protein VG815_00780 [Chloroflexota bacterium]|jgi:alpha-tubulin suppressor-like RCC1 family protein|nr:hypothetical protein [Chloroflexota bacterium]